MVIIKEHIRQHQNTFDVCERSNDGRLKVVRELRVRYARTTNKDGEIRHIIYDEQMRPIQPIYRYLNVGLAKLTPDTIVISVSPLRLLVAFCEAYGLKDFYIPELYCEDFVEFLYRNDKTQSTTAALYFQKIRGFLSYIGHDEDPIMAHTACSTWTDGADGRPREATYKNYKYAPKRDNERDMVFPEHNTVKDFYDIENVMRTHEGRFVKGDVTGCILIGMELMMGRRRGELLGVTIEDISTKVDEKTGEIMHVLYLRNRVTDVSGQFAKTRKHPKSVAYYKNLDYIRSYKHPRNCIWLSDELYRLIKAYIETEHRLASERHPEHYATAVADIVNPEQFAKDWGMEENHYLFLNYWGGRLKKDAWRLRLLEYYRLAGIPVGHGKSPNHSWRHTAAWILRHMLHKSTREIADYLGQKRTASAEVYAKADFESITELNAIVQKYIRHELEELNPSLTDYTNTDEQ